MTDYYVSSFKLKKMPKEYEIMNSLFSGLYLVVLVFLVFSFSLKNFLLSLMLLVLIILIEMILGELDGTGRIKRRIIKKAQGRTNRKEWHLKK